MRQANPNSVTEGTTRLLETPERPERQAPFNPNVFEQHGGLAQATSHIPQQANPTSRSLELPRKSTNWLLIGAVSVAVLALVALLIVTLRNRTVTPTVPNPPTVTIPQPPSIPAPPPPAPPKGLPHSETVNSKFIYPGSKTIMEITGDEDGNVLQLQTVDSFDKVVEWYRQKLNPKNTIKQANNVILNGDEMTAIINRTDEGTNIMLTPGDE
ncbi:MAG TPA: hypothetical protein VM095_20595 [Pyrinomonadaceae bacterium]|nr:hypothetical protein [Pyrinomonadaceae bacterium]